VTRQFESKLVADQHRALLVVGLGLLSAAIDEIE